MFCGPHAPTSLQSNLPERFNKAAKIFTGILMCLLSRSRKLLAKINKSSRSPTRLNSVFTLLGKVAMGASWDDSMNQGGSLLFSKNPLLFGQKQWQPLQTIGTCRHGSCHWQREEEAARRERGKRMAWLLGTRPWRTYDSLLLCQAVPPDLS